MDKVIDIVTNMTLTSVLVGSVVGVAVYWLIQKFRIRYRKPPDHLRYL